MQDFKEVLQVITPGEAGQLPCIIEPDVGNQINMVFLQDGEKMSCFLLSKSYGVDTIHTQLKRTGDQKVCGLISRCKSDPVYQVYTFFSCLGWSFNPVAVGPDIHFKLVRSIDNNIILAKNVGM
jgi:hypothetical protein